MIEPIELTTPRLVLRQWRTSDREPFAAINADDEVMRYFPGTLTRPQSDAWIHYVHAEIERQGWGLWAVEHRASATLIGALGLHHVEFDTPFTPAVEIGWRLARSVWNQGFATEAATAALDLAFSRLGLAEVVAFTVPQNVASRRVMERCGMTLDPDVSFDHPRVDPTSYPDLVRHVVYRIAAREWPEAHPGSVA